MFDEYLLTEEQVINAEWLLISLFLHCVYELHAGYIYWHESGCDHSRYSISSPRALKIADIFLPTNMFHPHKTTGASQKCYPRGDCFLWCGKYQRQLRALWDLSAWIESVFWSDCLEHKIASWIEAFNAFCVLFLYRETPKASSCWTMCVTTTTYSRKTTLVFDMWILRNRG